MHFSRKWGRMWQVCQPPEERCDRFDLSWHQRRMPPAVKTPASRLGRSAQMRVCNQCTVSRFKKGAMKFCITPGEKWKSERGSCHSWGDVCTGVGLREACAPPRGMKSSGMSEIKKCVFSLGGMCTWGLLLAKRYIILWIMHYSFE